MDEIICMRCILGNSINDIDFDENGECNYCKIHDELDKEYPLNEIGESKLNSIINDIKKAGDGKDYDCLVGVSGGRDSTYALFTAVKLGLRPLAVHFDNGWNSDIAVTNIKNTLEILNVDLYSYVVDWEEFKDLQISFLKASTSDAEIPTDMGLTGALYSVAKKFSLKYIITGISFRTEGFAPISWTYLDGRYIRSVQKIFGTKKLITFPNLTISKMFYYMFIKRINLIPILYFITYQKDKVKSLLEKELKWQYYGTHHHENTFTKFFQSYYLTQKFGIDKRKTELAAYVRSGQTTREEALEFLKDVPYEYDQDIVNYTISKLDITKDQFDEIMQEKNKSFRDYPTYYPYLKALKAALILAYKLKLIPKALYLRFVGV